MQDLNELTCPHFGVSSGRGGVSDGGNETLHIQSLNPMCMPSFISVSYPVSVICQLKPNNGKMMMKMNLQIELFQFKKNLYAILAIFSRCKILPLSKLKVKLGFFGFIGVMLKTIQPYVLSTIVLTDRNS